MNEEVAMRAADLQPMQLHGAQVIAASDEVDVMARMSQEPSEVTADATGAEYC